MSGARSVERERRRATEQVAAALAHELRAPIVAITSAAQLIRYRVSEDPVMEVNLGRILRETERLNAIASALSEYGHPSPLRRAPGDPDAVWSRVLHAHRGALESKAIIIRHDAAEPRAKCTIDAEQLAQAFGHLLANAIDAAPEGTDLTIESRTSGKSWKCALRDQGPGVPSEILPRAFDLFVSTKQGRAGLGLPLAKRIVDEHDGTIELKANEVVVVLPSGEGSSRP